MNSQIKTHCECCGHDLIRLTARGPVYIQSPIIIGGQEYVLCHLCLKAVEWSAQRIIAAIKNAPDAMAGKVSAKGNYHL